MKNILKNLVSLFINSFLNMINKFSYGRFINEQIIMGVVNRVSVVKHSNVSLKLAVPNHICSIRANTFSSKEPETLAWIDNLKENSIVWDIGANVGLYSCYAAKKLNCRVFAFEPSVFNLEFLARNINLNNLSDLVTIIPVPLTNEIAINKLNMSSTNWGGAMSTFGQSFGHDGLVLDKVFVMPTFGISMEDAVNLLKIPQPDYIKMDVDGIEHLILSGGKCVLNNAKAIIIEINDHFDVQSKESDFYLREAGFQLQEKLHASYFDSVDSAARYTFNQIWTK